MKRLIIGISIFILSFPAISFANVEDIGIWTDGAGSQLPGTVFDKFQFNTQARNDDSIYTKDAGHDDFTLTQAGNYLVLYFLHGEDTSNGRVVWNGKITHGGVDVPGSFSSSYARQTTDNEIYCRGTGLILNASANDTIAIEWRRDADTDTGGSVAGVSELMIVRLPNDNDVAYAHYSTPTAGAYGGGTFTDIPWTVIERETDTGVIARQAGNTDLRLIPANTNFLIIYGAFGTTGGSRTQRVTRAVNGATEIPGSNSYCYQRNGSNEYCSPYAMFIVRTDAGGNDDISIQMRRTRADVDGSYAINADAGVFIAELPSFSEIFISEDGTGGQDVAGVANVDLNWMRTATYNDAASFTRVDNFTMDVTKDMDALFMANGRIERSGTSTTRATVGVRFEIAGANQTRGQHGNYLRGNQGTQDTYNMSLNPAGIFAVNATNDVQIEAFDDGSNGSTDNTVAGSCGFMALNLDTLRPLTGAVMVLP